MTGARKGGAFVPYARYEPPYSTVPPALVRILVERKVGRNGWPVMVALCSGVHADGTIDRKSAGRICEMTPSLATRVVATFWLPTGYHPKARKCTVSPDVAARADTRWTREHRSEIWQLLSGNKSLVLHHQTPYYTANVFPQVDG